MIQFNLLPDVKLEFMRTKHVKKTAVAISVIVSAVALGLVIILFLTIGIFQKKHINDLTADIQRGASQLKQVKDLDKVLTIQNQLNSLPSLEANKPVTSRIFGFVEQFTPASATISKLDLNIDEQKITIDGSADSLETVNKYADTLKFTSYQAGDEQSKKAFSEVVLASFARSDKGATYELTAKFDPVLFDSASSVKLIVPNTITTRSETQRPTELFQPSNSNSGQ